MSILTLGLRDIHATSRGVTPANTRKTVSISIVMFICVRDDLIGVTEVDLFGGQHGDAAMAMLGIVPTEERGERGSRFRCLGLIQLNVGTPENDSLIWAPHACPASVTLNPSNASGSSTGSKSTSIRHDPLRPSSVAH